MFDATAQGLISESNFMFYVLTYSASESTTKDIYIQTGIVIERKKIKWNRLRLLVCLTETEIVKGLKTEVQCHSSMSSTEFQSTFIG